MSHSNNPPDSWDSNPAIQVSQQLSKLNVNATEFVPSGFALNQPNNQAPVVSVNSSNSMQVDSDKAPADSWEDAADENSIETSTSNATSRTNDASNATTPDGDMPMDTEDGPSGATGHSGSHVPASKPKTKVKPKPEEATTTEKEHVNIVFIGHVDAGKSTIGGQMMKLTGMVDARTLEKYEREAKEKNRETWYLSWCMDTNAEEREKGKTVEVGRAYFETQTKHFTILDAPGHKNFVPNMIGGAAQADLAVLVISARKGEFETGFERGGQTREHAMLVKTAGVKHLVVLINKMDDPTVNWDYDRYKYCQDKLTPYLRKVGFNPAKDVKFMPVSGLTGVGLLDPVGQSAPWYTEESFIPYIDSLPSFKRNISGPFMMPIVDKYSDMGTVVMGKVESGECVKGQVLAVYPNRTEVKVDNLWSDDMEVTKVVSGENIKVKLKGVEEADISAGFVLCEPSNPVKSCKTFDARVNVLEYDRIFCAGKTFVLHLQAIVEEVTMTKLICLVDKKTGEKMKPNRRFIKQDDSAIVRFVAEDVICMEKFQDYPQLGRFALRDEGKTVAIGIILKLVDYMG